MQYVASLAADCRLLAAKQPRSINCNEDLHKALLCGLLGAVIKRTVDISQRGAYLSLRSKQLVVRALEEHGGHEQTVPIEDLGVLCLSHPQITLTNPLLAALAEAGAAVIVCGRDRLPRGTLQPVSNHLEQVSRLRTQLDAPKPRTKRLWQQVVRQKIRAQAELVAPFQPDTALRMRALENGVKSGDTGNAEGHAAKLHWAALRSVLPPELQMFRRRPRAGDPINGMLNFGYVVLRTAVARALASAGLHPALGIHHHHRSNAFCLADDLVEPLRPLVDGTVWRLVLAGRIGVEQTEKAELLRLLTTEVSCGDQRGPLMVALHRVAASLAAALAAPAEPLLLPTYSALSLPAADNASRLSRSSSRDSGCTSADTAACG